jgi:uncharacterized protein (DUF1330 family)
MSKGYWVATHRAEADPQAAAAYAKLAVPAILAGGGRFLARGHPAAAHEHGLNCRTVLIEFDTLQAALDAYESPGYQAALVALDGRAVRDIRIVEGLT